MATRKDTCSHCNGKGRTGEFYYNSNGKHFNPNGGPSCHYCKGKGYTEKHVPDKNESDSDNDNTGCGCGAFTGPLVILCAIGLWIPNLVGYGANYLRVRFFSCKPIEEKLLLYKLGWQVIGYSFLVTISIVFLCYLPSIMRHFKIYLSVYLKIIKTILLWASIILGIIIGIMFFTSNGIKSLLFYEIILLFYFFVFMFLDFLEGEYKLGFFTIMGLLSIIVVVVFLLSILLANILQVNNIFVEWNILKIGFYSSILFFTFAILGKIFSLRQSPQ